MAYFLRKIQTLRVDNSRILTIKNGKFSEYYFHMNFNIWGDFKFCIKANFHSLNVQRSLERALISDRQSLIFIVKRLGEAKATAEHKFKF